MATKFPGNKCPHCGHKIDSTTNLKSPREPMPGDVSVCFYCAQVLKFNDLMVPVAIKIDDMMDWPFELQQEIHRIQRMIVIYQMTHPKISVIID